MPISDWRPVDPARARTLHDARLQTHHAVQLATALGISYLPRRDDDSHTNLQWLPEQGALASNAVSAGRSQIRVALQVAELTLMVLRDDRPAHTESLSGRTIEQAATWLRSRLKEAGLKEHSYTLQRHYEIPDHPVAHGAAFDTSARDAFTQLAHWFHDGARAMEAVRAAQPRSSTVRCWPHHFDVGLVIDAGAGKSVGAGLEPGDAYYDEPYFYVNMRPAPAPEKLTSALAGGGRWHVKEWIGAVLPGSSVSRDPAEQPRQAGAFLDSAVAAGLSFTSSSPSSSTTR